VGAAGDSRRFGDGAPRLERIAGEGNIELSAQEKPKLALVG
jgi:hypothetical protein